MLWTPPPSPACLEPDPVHVWRAALDLEPAAIHEFRNWLSPDERERAERFRVLPARDRFIAARGILRSILSRYTGGLPSGLAFGYQPHGKPFLTSSASQRGIRFNLSHSHGMALVGITRDREIGVDVEMVRPGQELERIAGRFFSEPELKAFRNSPSENRAEVFYRLWTLKEAYLKARGEGLSVPLASFSILLEPGSDAVRLSVPGSESENNRWTLSTLLPAPGHWAAVVVEGKNLGLSLLDWPPKS